MNTMLEELVLKEVAGKLEEENLLSSGLAVIGNPDEQYTCLIRIIV